MAVMKRNNVKLPGVIGRMREERGNGVRREVCPTLDPIVMLKINCELGSSGAGRFYRIVIPDDDGG
jgi:hypothetical protein